MLLVGIRINVMSAINYAVIAQNRYMLAIRPRDYPDYTSGMEKGKEKLFHVSVGRAFGTKRRHYPCTSARQETTTILNQKS
jgi:hypothetical protein